jgi:hypothetical protein
MMITEDIKRIHKQLSNCSVKFLEFVEKDPDCLMRSSFSSLQWHDKQIKLQPWPTFINRNRKKDMEIASIRLCNLIKQVPRRIFNNNPAKISQYYRMPLDIVKMQLDTSSQEHIDQLMARGDFIISASGLKCIEFNVSSDLGGLEKPIWESMYLNTPIISKFLENHQVQIKNTNLLTVLLRHLLDIALSKWPRQKKINIAFVIPGYRKGSRNKEFSYLSQSYREVLEVKNKHLQGQIIFCDYHHLSTSNNGVYLEENMGRVHILIELYTGMVMPEILDRFKQGNILLYNGPITRLLSSKLNLGLLSENENSAIFNEEERKIIQTYIPWSRKIDIIDTTYKGTKVRLDNFLLSNKEKFLIKPSEGAGGMGVCVGKNTTAAQWREAVELALSQKKWLTQEYVQSLPYLYQVGENGCSQHNVIWGGFVFGSEYVGEWVRLLARKDSKGIINRKQGAEEGIVFEVEET